VGVPCDHGMAPQPGVKTVTVVNNAFTPQSIAVASGTPVTFAFQGFPHTVETVSTNMADPIKATKDPGGDPEDFSQAVPAGQQRVVTVTGMPGGEINYQCGIHGSSMTGKIMII